MKVPADELLNGLATAVLLLDHDRRILFLNNSAEGLLAVSAARAHGQLAEDLLGAGVVLQGAVAVATKGRTVTLREIEIRHAPGNYDRLERVRVDCTVSPFSIGADKLMVLAELMPVEPPALATCETNRNAHRRAPDQVIESLVHEIKNPLGGLRGAAQLLDQQLSSPKLRDYTKIIITEADRLADLADGMIGSRGPLSSTPVNLHEVLEYVRQSIYREFNNVKIYRDYDPSIPNVTGHKGNIIQAFLNVARNAAEAVGRRGNIRFRTRVRRQFTVNRRRYRHVLEASISDSGPGISKEQQARIFLPTIAQRDGDLEIGLSQAREMIDRQGGAIECASRPGDTKFTFFLPVGSDI